MKKIFHFIIIVWLLLSSFLIAKSSLSLKLPPGKDIQLNIDSSQDQNDIVEVLLDTCKKYELDIYKPEYLGSIDGKDLFKVYYTNTSSNNIFSTLSVVNGEFNGSVISTKFSKNDPYIKAFNLDIDYEFHNLKDAINDTKIEGVYKITAPNEGAVDGFINELKEHNIVVDVLGKGSSVKTNENIEIIVFFIAISLLISFYLIIQNQKDISIKKLNGYSNKNIILENNLNLIKKFSVYAIMVSIIDIIVLVLMKEFDSLFDYVALYYVVQLISILILLVLSNIANLYLLKIHPISGIKNFAKDIVIDLSNMIVKIATVTMIILYLVSLSNTLTDLYNISSNVKNWEPTKNIAYTITQGYYPSTAEDEKIFERKFKDLYTKLNDAEKAILLDTTSLASNIQRSSDNVNTWDYDSSKVIMNKNYVSRSNIQSSIKDKVNKYSITDTILLIPSEFKLEEEKIKANYFVNLPLNHKDQTRLKTIIYEEDISLFTANLDVETKGNLVQNPIIVIDENNFQDFYYLGVFSSGSIHIPIKNPSNPYAEIKSTIVDSGLDSTIKVTPLVYSRYSEKISEFNANLAKAFLQLFLLFIIGGTLLYNSILIFFVKNSKEIGIKKMMGYKPFEIYLNYFKDMLFTWTIVSICSYLYLRSFSFIFMLLAFMIFESVLTYVLIRIQERKNILSMLKGNQ